ncbi:hypothetical protein DD237_007209 [Peronospora effusa]|uniref:Cyclin-dependent kinase 2 homolog n=1 Tax=Peronospora effusa TaxID=542832 RepID=A0A425BYM4_9STRA|nr:hypothetical protein DD237_007209 [Peronospora effusa]
MDTSSSTSRISYSSNSTPLKKRRATSTERENQGSLLPLEDGIPIKKESEKKRDSFPLLLCATGAENPILAALGGTPRSQVVAKTGFLDSKPLNLSQCIAETSMNRVKEEKKMASHAAVADIAVVEEECKVHSLNYQHKEDLRPVITQEQKQSYAVSFVKTESSFVAASFVGKRKRADESIEAETTDFVAYAREHIHSQEVGEEGFSIDPSERAVEHRASKAVRREILIASPAANDEDDWEGNRPLEVRMNEVEPVLTPSEHFDLQPIDIILHVFSFLVTAKDLQSMAQVSKKWKELTSRRSLYRSLPSVTPEGSVNWINFKNLGIKNKGTEGTCIKCCQRSTGKILAIKKARVFPKGEGVPYYMLRELAVLKGIKHDHIASLELISLAKDELHVFFPYVDKTLHEVINPTGDPTGGRVLPESVIRKLLHQLLDAIAYCHRRGVLHRNLKPKHLLIKASDTANLSKMS